ncbi:MAG: oxidoreductase [Pseudomonadota bacterium]
MRGARPSLAVWKFASCDGCQLSVLDGVEELLDLVGAIEVAHFLEASSHVVEGPYDLSLVEGSITTAADAERIRDIRRQSKMLVTIGACATAGGIQSLRNDADVDVYKRQVYPRPALVNALPTSTPIGQHVVVDYELRGCPIMPAQLREVLSALLDGRRPFVPTESVCTECKRRGVPCVLVARREPCLGPITQAGCGALCPGVARGCYGCFGPMESPNIGALRTVWTSLGIDEATFGRALRSFNADAPAFRDGAASHGH